MMTESRPEALRALRDWFGHADFQGPQEETIDHLLAGGNALVILPTGGGKSLCYQLPAMLMSGVTVVLSPLIALMQDQVDQLRKRGLPATYINSSLDRRERERRLADVVAGKIRLLYVTPERFRKQPFVEALREVRVPLLAVDEAHCISAWGHDFRPEYGRLGKIRELLGDPPTVALTATATLDTRRDILERLRIPDARLFMTGIERRNLHLGVRTVQDGEERYARIVEVLRSVGGPGIVYMSLIKDLRILQDGLYRDGFFVHVYHGDLERGERRRMQREFIDSDDGIILATNAFGMGVDKPNIRFILHAQIPGSVEAYFQEVGRAGRDGEDSLCELLYLQEDLMIQKQFVEWANPDAAFVRNQFNLMARWGEELYAHDLDELRETLLLKNRADGRPEMVMGLLRSEGIIDGTFERGDIRIVRPLAAGEEEVLVHSGKRDRDLRRLLEIVEYARSTTCRKESIHGYFGLEWAKGNCGSCDRCRDLDEVLAAFPQRPVRKPSQGLEETAPVAVGDWLRVRGRFVVCVKSVTRDARGRWVIQGQSADDFKIRSYNLSEMSWEPAEG
ncbi:MAG: RecQ family ATP-dependent DNA helicase [Planctomycetota bacterium]